MSALDNLKTRIGKTAPKAEFLDWNTLKRHKAELHADAGGSTFSSSHSLAVVDSNGRNITITPNEREQARSHGSFSAYTLAGIQRFKLMEEGKRFASVHELEAVMKLVEHDDPTYVDLGLTLSPFSLDAHDHASYESALTMWRQLAEIGMPVTEPVVIPYDALTLTGRIHRRTPGRWSISIHPFLSKEYLREVIVRQQDIPHVTVEQSYAPLRRFALNNKGQLPKNNDELDVFYSRREVALVPRTAIQKCTLPRPAKMNESTLPKPAGCHMSNKDDSLETTTTKTFSTLDAAKQMVKNAGALAGYTTISGTPLGVVNSKKREDASADSKPYGWRQASQFVVGAYSYTIGGPVAAAASIAVLKVVQDAVDAHTNALPRSDPYRTTNKRREGKNRTLPRPAEQPASSGDLPRPARESTSLNDLPRSAEVPHE